jgi:hypothetical protein
VLQILEGKIQYNKWIDVHEGPTHFMHPFLWLVLTLSLVVFLFSRSWVTPPLQFYMYLYDFDEVMCDISYIIKALEYLLWKTFLGSVFGDGCKLTAKCIVLRTTYILTYWEFFCWKKVRVQ